MCDYLFTIFVLWLCSYDRCIAIVGMNNVYENFPVFKLEPVSCLKIFSYDYGIAYTQKGLGINTAYKCDIVYSCCVPVSAIFVCLCSSDCVYKCLAFVRQTI